VRGSWLVGVFGGAVAMTTANGCGGYCYGPAPFFQDSIIWRDRGPKPEIPVDAAPWLLRRCEHRGIPVDCALVIDGERFPVSLELSGSGACHSDADEYYLSDHDPAVIQRLRPRDPLPPGAIATLDCDVDDDGKPADDPYDYYDNDQYFEYGFGDDDYRHEIPLTLKIRATTAPAAPPEPIEGLQLQYTRQDYEQDCTNDILEVKFELGAQYLEEGGFIEVVYPNGEVFQFSHFTRDGVAVLPGSRGPLRFTPVAADGERGDTIEVGEDDIDVPAVYVPRCAVASSPGDFAGLLILTILALRRRRPPGAGP
jgi:hypothetical protein